MYVPSKYNGSRAFPLIIALHGLGGTEDSFFDNYEKAFPPLAERTATSSRRRSAIALTDRTAGDSALRRRIRRHGGSRSEARPT